MAEQWKSIPGFEGLYSISSEGNVWSEARTVRGPRGSTRERGGRLVSASVTSNGYKTVHLWRENKRTTRTVHSLVAEVFLAPPEEGRSQVCHNNGDPLDNRVGNLRWGSPRENSADRKGHGTYICGKQVANSRLTDENVVLVRTLYAGGTWRQSDLAERFGVDQAQIGRVIAGKAWAHVA